MRNLLCVDGASPRSTFRTASILPGSELPRLEGIAACHLSRPQPIHEPAHALLRGAVGKRVRYDVALAPTLQAIVANSGGGLHSCLDVARLDEPPLFLRVVSPDSGQAVRLQLHVNLELIGLDLIHTALRLLHLRQYSKQVLHVMTDVMRDDIGLGELTAFASDITTAEPPLKILKERSVQIDLAIDRTVERTHGGLGNATSRTRAARKHDERGRLVVLPSLRENFLPLSFRASKYGTHELIRWTFRLGRTGSGLGLLL